MRRKLQNGRSANRRPIHHVHVGLGKLGIGAVVPFLHLQFPNRQLLIVQRATRWWAALEDNSFCYLKNTAGFFKAHKVWKPASPGALEEKIKTLKKPQKEAILIIVPHIGYVTSLLKTLNDRQTTVSCCVADGQAELATSLKDASAKWECLFLFENTFSGCWAERGLKSKVHHIVVDRICWHLKPDDKQKAHVQGVSSPDEAGKEFPERECICEKDYSSFQWPKNGVRFQPIDKEKRKLAGFSPEDRFEAVEKIELAARKKRALVNATHAILGILCCRLLAKREMRPEKQYLAPLQALLKDEYPEWHEALDTYIRMRSIEVSLEEIGDGTIYGERCQMVFARNYREARRAHLRFLNTADLLERLMSGERFQKELGKYDEHIVEPFRSYERNRLRIENHFGYEQPDRVEIIFLKDFLNDSFLQAMKWLSKREHK